MSTRWPLRRGVGRIFCVEWSTVSVGICRTGKSRGGARLLGAVATLCCLLYGNTAASQGVIAYPAKGQSADQQSRDRYDCHVWAVQQSGFDPTQQIAQGAPPPAPTTGLVPGAARGAAVGAVGGAIGGNAGKGAAIGAASGALIGGIRRNEQLRRQQAYQQQSGSSTPQRATYERALKTCLQGRGYTVN
jgi:hypothetical protein